MKVYAVDGVHIAEVFDQVEGFDNGILGGHSVFSSIIQILFCWNPVYLIREVYWEMMIANVPVVFTERWIMDRLSLNYARWGAFALFLAMAVITMVTTL